MPYMTGKVELTIYNDAAQTDFPLVNVPSISRTFSDTDVAEVQTTVITLAASGSQAITFNGLDSVTKWALFSSTSDLTLTINGTAGFTYKAGIPGWIPITLTSLTITNASSSVATTVELVMVKE